MRVTTDRDDSLIEEYMKRAEFMVMFYGGIPTQHKEQFLTHPMFEASYTMYVHHFYENRLPVENLNVPPQNVSHTLGDFLMLLNIDYSKWVNADED